MFKHIRLSSTTVLPQTQTFSIPLGTEDLFPSLLSTFTAPSWMHFDLTWLSICDVCLLASFDPLPGLNKSHASLNSDVPLYDTLYDTLCALRNENLYNLMHTMREYKNMLVVSGFFLNPILEDKIHTSPHIHDVARFSIVLWSLLDKIPESRSNAPSHF